MRHQSLKLRIYAFLRKHPNELICGGEIQTMAAKVGFEPQNAGRRLRELVAEGRILVEYKPSKHGAKVAWYKYIPSYAEVFHREMSMR